MKSLSPVLLTIAGLGWYYVGYAAAPYAFAPGGSTYGAGSFSRFIGIALALIGIVAFILDLRRKPPAPPSPLTAGTLTKVSTPHSRSQEKRTCNTQRRSSLPSRF